MPAQGAGASKQQALFGIPAQKSSPAHTRTPQAPARPVPSPAAPQQNQTLRPSFPPKTSSRVSTKTNAGSPPNSTARCAYSQAPEPARPALSPTASPTESPAENTFPNALWLSPSPPRGRRNAPSAAFPRCRRSPSPNLSLRSAASTQVFLAQRYRRFIPRYRQT